MKAETDKSQKQMGVVLAEKSEIVSKNRELIIIIDELKQKLLKSEANRTKLENDIIEVQSRLSLLR